MDGSALVADACILITFGSVGALDIVTGLNRHRPITTSRALGEVTKAPAVSAVQDAVDVGDLAVTSIDLSNPTEQGNLARFDNLPAFRDRADAEILAVSVSRGHLVCSDDPAVRRTAVAELGRSQVAGSLDLLVWAVREERLSVVGAVSLFNRLDVAPGIQRKLQSEDRVIDDLFEN